MSFDLDPWGRYLGIGDEAGKVSVWDVGGAGQWGEKAWEAQFADAEGEFYILTLWATWADIGRCYQLGTISPTRTSSTRFFRITTC